MKEESELAVNMAKHATMISARIFRKRYKTFKLVFWNVSIISQT